MPSSISEFTLLHLSTMFEFLVLCLSVSNSGKLSTFQLSQPAECKPTRSDTSHTTSRGLLDDIDIGKSIKSYPILPECLLIAAQ